MACIPPQFEPFEIPASKEGVTSCLLRPLDLDIEFENAPTWPPAFEDGRQVQSAHPFHGGETEAKRRLEHLLSTGAMTTYSKTRNGLLGSDFSTKLSAYLAIGCLSARVINDDMVLFEDGEVKYDGPVGTREEKLAKLERWKSAPGFGEGENNGTAAVRSELLWRDYFRLVLRKYGAKLFAIEGIRGEKTKEWQFLEKLEGDEVSAKVKRFCTGRTGIGLIDAAQRELFLTGYTSNRARQNVASFLTKHLHVDWRIGAEWFEAMLVDFDAASNWGNWQYVAGVGNDPREGRLFNPVKQALDYDSHGEYIKAWVPELRGIDLGPQMAGGKYDGEKLMTLFQAWKLSEDDKKLLELKGVDWVEKPLIQIEFSVSRKPRSAGQNKGRGRGGRHGRGGQLKSGASSIESSSTGSQGSNWRGARWRGRGRQ